MDDRRDYARRIHRRRPVFPRCTVMEYIAYSFLVSAWIVGQAAYWLLMRDDSRDAVVWSACLLK
jgi:hypothetical protein